MEIERFDIDLEGVYLCIYSQRQLEALKEFIMNDKYGFIRIDKVLLYKQLIENGGYNEYFVVAYDCEDNYQSPPMELSKLFIINDISIYGLSDNVTDVCLYNADDQIYITYAKDQNDNTICVEYSMRNKLYVSRIRIVTENETIDVDHLDVTMSVYDVDKKYLSFDVAENIRYGAFSLIMVIPYAVFDEWIEACYIVKNGKINIKDPSKLIGEFVGDGAYIFDFKSELQREALFKLIGGKLQVVQYNSIYIEKCCGDKLLMKNFLNGHTGKFEFCRDFILADTIERFYVKPYTFKDKEIVCITKALDDYTLSFAFNNDIIHLNYKIRDGILKINDKEYKMDRIGYAIIDMDIGEKSYKIDIPMTLCNNEIRIWQC